MPTAPAARAASGCSGKNAGSSAETGGAAGGVVAAARDAEVEARIPRREVRVHARRGHEQHREHEQAGGGERGQRVGCGLAPAPHRPESTPRCRRRRPPGRRARAGRGVPSDATWQLPRTTSAPAASASTRSSSSIGAGGCCRRSCSCVLDLTGVTLALYAALVLRNAYRGEEVLFGLPWAAVSTWLQFIALVLVLVFARAGLYRQREARPGADAVIRSLALVTIITAFYAVAVAGMTFHSFYGIFWVTFVLAADARAAAARELRQRHARADAPARRAPPHGARRPVRRALGARAHAAPRRARARPRRDRHRQRARRRPRAASTRRASARSPTSSRSSPSTVPTTSS